MLHYVLVCCCMLHYVAVCCNMLFMLQYVSVCCSMLNYVAICGCMLQYVTVCCNVLQYVAVCCSMLQHVAAYWIMLHYVAVCCCILPLPPIDPIFLTIPSHSPLLPTVPTGCTKSIKFLPGFTFTILHELRSGSTLNVTGCTHLQLVSDWMNCCTLHCQLTGTKWKLTVSCLSKLPTGSGNLSCFTANAIACPWTLCNYWNVGQTADWMAFLGRKT